MKWIWYETCRNENDSSQCCVPRNCNVLSTEEKKMNIAFKSIWFRFNFSSFFSPFRIYRCFVRQFIYKSSNALTLKKKTVNKKWRKNCCNQRSYVIWCWSKNMHFPHSSTNRLSVRQVQVVFFFFFCIESVNGKWNSVLSPYNCNLFTPAIKRQKKIKLCTIQHSFFLIISTTFVRTHAVQIMASISEIIVGLSAHSKVVNSQEKMN